MNRIIGIILIVTGIVMLIWTGFSFTKEEKIIDAGPLEVSAEKKETFNWPPYLGVILLAGGIIVVVTSNKKT